MIHPVTRLHGLARRETDGRVLAAHRRNGVVQHVLPIDKVDVGRPKGTIAWEVDDGAVGEHGADLRPWTD